MVFEGREEVVDGHVRTTPTFLRMCHRISPSTSPHFLDTPPNDGRPPSRPNRRSPPNDGSVRTAAFGSRPPLPRGRRQGVINGPGTAKGKGPTQTALTPGAGRARTDRPGTRPRCPAWRQRRRRRRQRKAGVDRIRWGRELEGRPARRGPDLTRAELGRAGTIRTARCLARVTGGGRGAKPCKRLPASQK